MKYLLVDISGIIYRAFFALDKDKFQRSDGFPTNAILGTINILKHLNKRFPEHTFVACRDGQRKDLKRSESDPDYKTNRKNADPILVQQFDSIFHALDSLHIVQLKVQGHEADDIIASFCKIYSAGDHEITIATSDKDMNQLLVLPGVQIYNPAKKEMVTHDTVLSKFKVAPENFIFYQALIGDKVDNISGIKGVGPKTACKIIEKYNTPANFMQSTDHKYESNIAEFKNSLELVTLCTDLDMSSFSVDMKQNFKSKEFKEFCKSMEIRH